MLPFPHARSSRRRLARSAIDSHNTSLTH
jgi:hypothetical protein